MLEMIIEEKEKIKMKNAIYFNFVYFYKLKLY